MNKFLLSLIATAASVAFLAPVQAQTADFDVAINLTSVCKITNSPGNVGFTYTSLQAGASNLDANGSFGLTCTNTLAYTTALDAGGSYTDDATNLNYSLTLAPVAAGTGALQTYAITGSMPGNQAGTCATASCTNALATNKTRTLTVAY